MQGSFFSQTISHFPWQWGYVDHEKMKIVGVMDKDLSRDSVHNTWNTLLPWASKTRTTERITLEITLSFPFTFNLFGFYYFQYDSSGNT